MVTGDNIQTAKAIALECGILSVGEDLAEPTVIEGKQFRALSESERELVAKRITVRLLLTFYLLVYSVAANIPATSIIILKIFYLP